VVGNELELACNYMVHRAAKARDHHTFIGTRRDRLRRADTAGGWALFGRHLELDAFTLTAANISILL
jgi:3-phenylpropionate/trans-cinnamate dioxygenase subunit beta